MQTIGGLIKRLQFWSSSSNGGLILCLEYFNPNSQLIKGLCNRHLCTGYIFVSISGRKLDGVRLCVGY